MIRQTSFLIVSMAASVSFAQGLASGPINREFQTIRPLLKRFCHECHCDEVAEADIDLSLFKSVSDARKQTKVWLKVREMLDSRQMPPKDAEQPSESDYRQLQSWVRDFLAVEAKANAGDPGPVILRRLTNAEYNHTLRDLSGVESLDPTGEFPVDGAAGEGFTNAGSGQAMSPSLVQKYLDAAKDVAGHVVLLPDGIRFSPHTTERDRTDHLMGRIQAFYRPFTEDAGGSAVDLQGIKFETNQGGRLPLQKYLAATLAERDALSGGAKSIDEVARERGLTAKYLGTLWETLSAETDTGASDSVLMDWVRARWRSAQEGDAEAFAAEVAAWQHALWKFNSIGHIGRQGGPTSWMETVSPIRNEHELRFKLPQRSDNDIVIYLAASDLGDGNESDFVVWQHPRIEFAAGESGVAHPPVPLRDVQSRTGQIMHTIANESARTKQYLSAVANPNARTTDDGLNSDLIQKWRSLVKLDDRAKVAIGGHLVKKLTRGHGYDAINGWGGDEALSLLTNRSEQPISFLTLTVPARGVTLHPSPSVDAIVYWRSPIDGRLQVDGFVADADDKCGNGAAWRVELSSVAGTSELASGVFDNGQRQTITIDETITVRQGDVLALIVNARDSSHSCDTTHIDWKLTEVEGEARVWNLAADVVDQVEKGNPLPDSYGNKQTWHFCGSGDHPAAKSFVVIDSVLDHWRVAVMSSSAAEEIDRFAQSVQNLLITTNPDELSEADKQQRRRLLDWKGPLSWVTVTGDASGGASVEIDSGYGLTAARFGKHPDGASIDDTDLCVRAPQMLEVRLPAPWVAGGEFVATGLLHAETGQKGSVQDQVLAEKPTAVSISSAVPILVGPDAAVRRGVESSMDSFRDLFPPALCYARIVPVDEVVTLTLFHRDDDHLKRLMLDDQQAADLDRLWDELYFVSREPIKLTVALEQIMAFATQDRPDLVTAFEPMKKPVNDRADAFRQRLIDVEPVHVTAVLEFASRAWRRPLAESEQQSLHDFYRGLRDSEIGHEQAIELTLARVLTSPAFLYKLEQPASDQEIAAVSDFELATRLSYFLWSSLPDDPLRAVAESGQLRDDGVLIEQTRRMLSDSRTRRLAIQFACQWLHLRDFDKNDDKNEKLYPQFAALRHDMYEETVLFFEDMFRTNGSILGLLNADHTFLNEDLARHYGMTELAHVLNSESGSASSWKRVDDIRHQGRGGILTMATFLASQSGASRTSPILRGNWIYETLLGERLPRPPAGVPQLPETLPSGLTARQLIERHSSVPECAQCHARIDPFGFALEQYDAIGRLRTGKADTKTTLGGKTVDGVEGLREYLIRDRREDVMRQFCRKLLGFSLGREVMLSDEPLIDRMTRELSAGDGRFWVAVEMIVQSEQFRSIRPLEPKQADP